MNISNYFTPHILYILLIAILVLPLSVSAQSEYISYSRDESKEELANLQGAGGVRIISSHSDLVISVRNAKNPVIIPKGLQADKNYVYDIIINLNDTRHPKVEINRRGDVNSINFVVALKADYYSAYRIKEVAKPILLENQTKANDIITNEKLAQVEINSPLSELSIECPKELDADIKTTKKPNDESITVTTITFPVQPILDAKASLTREIEALTLLDRNIQTELDQPKLTENERMDLADKRDLQAKRLMRAEDLWDRISKIVVYSEGTNHLYIDISEAAPRRKFCWGILLREGKVVEKGVESIQQGDPITMLTQAKSYEQGLGSYTKDLNQALIWYEKSAEAGSHEAQEYLADVLYNGNNGFSQDHVKAFKWNSICADRGNIAAIKKLGTLYAKGLGCEMDKKKAILLLTKYNKQTIDNEAQLLLAQTIGTKEEEGLTWLKSAADNGNAEAMRHYASLVIQANPTEGEKYYRLSAGKGYAQGQYEWGRILVNGLYGITKNGVEGRQFLTEAKKNGIKEAEHAIAAYDLSASNDKTIAALSALIPEYHERAKHGDANAMYMLYFLYKHKNDYKMANRMAFCVLYNHMHDNDWFGLKYKQSYGNYYAIKTPEYLKKAFNLRHEDMSIYQIFYSGKDVSDYERGIPHVMKYFIKDDIGATGHICDVAGALKTSAYFGILLSNKIRAQIPGYLKGNKGSYFKDERKEIKEFMKSYDWLFTDRPDTARWVQEYIDAGYLNPDNKNRRLQYVATNKDPNDPEAQYKRLQDNVAALEKAAANYDGDALIKLYITYKILGKYSESFANKALSLKYAIVRNIGFARTCNVSIFSNALDIDLLKQAGIYEERKNIIIKFEKKINIGTERYKVWAYKEPAIGERTKNHEFVYEDLYKFYNDNNIINFSRNNHAKHGEIYKNPITKGNMLNHSITKGIQFEDYYNYSEKEIYKKYANFIKQFYWEKPEHFRKAHNIAKERNEMQKQIK